MPALLRAALFATRHAGTRSRGTRRAVIVVAAGLACVAATGTPALAVESTSSAAPGTRLATVTVTPASRSVPARSATTATTTTDTTTTDTRATTPTVDPAPATCPGPTLTVSTAAELTAALKKVAPGAVIALRPGVYSGRFVADRSGTASAPITLCGPSDAILDGGSTKKGYVLHLDGVSHWRVLGLTVRDGQKGVMADGVRNTLLRGLTVERIGDEAIHLRRNSVDNQVVGNRVSGTGLRSRKYGEGIYVGTAESNWTSITGGAPDRSDRNEIRGNTVSGTTSEAVDIKEGTTGGTLADNVFDGATITAADSAVDVKGNGWRITGNTVLSAPKDGFQTHRILPGWGDGNTFSANVVRSARRTGSVVATTPTLGNVVTCDNLGPKGMTITVASVACR